MRYLIFTNTPAHVHCYRNAVSELEARGHDVLVLARDYGCTVDLAEWYDLPHEVYGACETSKWSLLANLPAQYARALRAARRFDPDLIFGMGGYAAHTGALTRTPVVLLIDSEVTGLDHAISTPFARTVLTPDTFQTQLCDEHYVFPGLKECAYLHPEVRERGRVGADRRSTIEHPPAITRPPTTDHQPIADQHSTTDRQLASVRDRLGLDRDEPYAIVRLNAFGSHHDVGKGGFTPDRRRQLIETLAEYATVLVSDEGGDLAIADLPARPFSLHPARLHDALDEAALLVADTQTMVTEAALLGTPAIRSNSFVGEEDMGNFRELERQGLIFNEAEFDAVLERAPALLAADGTDETWRRRRDAFLADRCNLTRVIVDVATARGDPESVDALVPFDGVDAPEPTPESVPAEPLPQNE
ncbi:hypothetical protein C479_06337 [Halovivax asiaticus JCM 14624]|uniref:DUF354 domain-containing protein n=1 Tax=Halovivax asiaticus JCM 14624 TaxID=1227490 RepID=M0BL89_9EURY|nr:hypothetical protein [Halovivax asiaticus]ELZ11651.1 hypothetical protein C479_06337 [Halovivax asiaticus JCM 14624]